MFLASRFTRYPVPPRERVESVPVPVSAIVMRLLAKTPEERYQAASGVDRKIEPGALHRLESTDLLEDVQRQYILRVLDRTGWVISGPNGAGAILNVHPNTLRSLMNRLGIRHQAMPRPRRGPEFSQRAHDACPE
jgi:transcriptional regulator with GAF, ATPase, and Fis domain